MNTLTRHTLCSLVAIAPLGIAAQNLSTEIEVDRTVVPQEREFVRPGGFSPQVVTPSVPTRTPSPAEYSGQHTITPYLPLLQPSSFGSVVEHTPYRGYATVGYFPLLFAGGSAGYRFIDNDSFTIGADLQINSERYSRECGSDGELTYKNFYSNAGVYAAYRFDPSHVLSGAVDYTFAFNAHPTAVDSPIQYAHGINAAVKWDSRSGILPYSVDAAYSGFGFTKSTPTAGLFDFHQNIFSLGGKLAWSFLSADLRLSHSSYTDGALSGSSLLVNLTPRASFSFSDFRADLGANVDFYGGDTGGIALSPDVRLSYAPKRLFAAYIDLLGGSSLHSIAQSYTLYPTANRIDSPAVMRVPIDARAGFDVTYFGAYVAYSSAEDALMPAVDGPALTLKPVAVTGWRWGAFADYSACRWFSAHADYETLVGSHRRGYYRWTDRARYQIHGSLTAKPLANLDITAAYIYRGSRMFPLVGGSDIDASAAKSLDLSASYRITPAMTVSLTCENILCDSYLLAPGIAAPPIHGLASFSLKF